MVVDEHGGVEGIVTIKDLVAELVGELQDEFDPGRPIVAQLGPNVWIADGRLDIDDLEEAVDYNLTDGPYSTVGGYIMALYGKVPEDGEQVEVDGFRYTVVSMDRQRVDRVKVRAPDRSQATWAGRLPAFGTWRSLAARIVRDDEVVGSNPTVPTRGPSQRRGFVVPTNACITPPRRARMSLNRNGMETELSP